MNPKDYKMILEVAYTADGKAVKPHRIAADNKIQCIAKAITRLEGIRSKMEEDCTLGPSDIVAFLWHENVYMSMDAVAKILNEDWHDCVVIELANNTVKVTDDQEVSSDRKWMRDRKHKSTPKEER